MAGGQRRLKLAQRWHCTSRRGDKVIQVYEYIVLSVVNATAPNVGDKLTKERVDELIGNGHETTIVPYKAS